MARSPKAEIRKITHDALKNLLTYKVSHDVLDFLKSGAERNFREFEGAQHHTYPIKACGIRAEPGKLRKGDEFLLVEEPLAPEVTTQHLQGFPIDAVSGVYCFTILEIYGDDLVRVLNPSGVKNRMSWHRVVPGNLKNLDRKQVRKVGREVQQMFELRNSVPVWLLKRIAQLKSARNTFIHTGDSDVSFSEYFEKVCSIVCQLHFACTKDKHVVVFPFEDLEERWKDRW